jgi:hypothetical protein
MIDRGAAIKNNAVHSTTAGNTNLGGWSGRARERSVLLAPLFFQAITHTSAHVVGTYQRISFSSVTQVAKSTWEAHALNRETSTHAYTSHACKRPAPCATDAAVGVRCINATGTLLEEIK